MRAEALSRALPSTPERRKVDFSGLFHGCGLVAPNPPEHGQRGVRRRWPHRLNNFRFLQMSGQTGQPIWKTISQRLKPTGSSRRSTRPPWRIQTMATEATAPSTDIVRSRHEHMLHTKPLKPLTKGQNYQHPSSARRTGARPLWVRSRSFDNLFASGSTPNGPAAHPIRTWRACHHPAPYGAPGCGP